MVAEQRQVLVAESDDAYDRAQVALTDNLKILAFLEVLVAEAKLDRFDRERPAEVSELVFDSFFDENEDAEDSALFREAMGEDLA